jgi:hypothetical protein
VVEAIARIQEQIGKQALRNPEPDPPTTPETTPDGQGGR